MQLHIQALLTGQRDLILASQRLPNSHALIIYPIGFRSKLATNVEVPTSRSVCGHLQRALLRSFVDPIKTLSMHASRLLPYIDNLAYNSSPTIVAATDYDESVIDYITAHEGNPARPESMRFRVNWLGQADDEATWQSFDSLKLTAALDNYIVDNLPSNPQLFHLVPPKDRTGHSGLPHHLRLQLWGASTPGSSLIHSSPPGCSRYRH